MKVEDIRTKAKGLGVRTSKCKKDELIRAIQHAEGSFACFGTSDGECDQYSCCWRDDCLSKASSARC